MTFLRRLSNPFTTWQARSPPSHDITEVTKDNIFLLHLSFVETFCRLDEESLLTAYIVSNKSAATKILEACHQLAIINPSNGEPATANIDRGMVRAMPSLSVGKQRELVMLLFFWEEEVTRWKLLSAEENDLRKTLRDYELRERHRLELQHALQVIQAKKRTVPSLRRADGQIIECGVLPTYEEAKRGPR